MIGMIVVGIMCAMENEMTMGKEVFSSSEFCSLARETYFLYYSNSPMMNRGLMKWAEVNLGEMDCPSPPAAITMPHCWALVVR